MALNLHLIHPREAIGKVEAAHHERGAQALPLARVEGFIRGVYW